jgi:dTDP-4-amino-4,6-dideoxygalactose transaminase
LIPWALPLAQTRAHRRAIDTAVARVLDSGIYVLGEEVAAFEREFAAYCGAAHAVGVASGTDALVLALRALGIGPGDEVITVSQTALATAAAVLAAGAIPVFIDIDESYMLDPSRLEAAIGPRAKAVIAVHLYGLPANLDAIARIARPHGLKLIEDCAQAAGARYRGRMVGSLADIGCFSFYPTKNLGAVGDGGMVTTSDEVLVARLRRLRQYGWNDRRETEEPGLNSRLDPLQAAILRVKLPFLDADNSRRRSIAATYAQGLAGLPLVLPSAREDAEHAYHLYVVACEDRDALIRHLGAQGVGTAIHYPVPAHLHPGYAERARLPKEGLPLTNRIAGRIVSLPMYPELSDNDVNSVIAAVRGFYGGRRKVASVRYS